MTDIMDGWKGKCIAAVEKYQNGRKALLSLRGPGDWTEELCDLKDSDMTSMYGSVLDASKVTMGASVV